MNLSGLPTGTVSSGRPGSDTGPDRDRTPDADPETRIAELKRENEALRAAVEKQRRENERIVERYERLLEQERAGKDTTTDDEPTTTTQSPSSAPEGDALGRVARFFGL
ncbi:hypothetical protein [Haloplanus aerogenes]|uniref:Uncharacterized protein n=1 Tax=Haloplanus aerogenes TaxID=660522 RepID=A0A3M0CW60_9EURY|nr:hypothetical protein [Haloplanus aerogenes]AZH23997.1 hypothetical protein DU502_00780 [Haloplanus aerogenes]RMB13234.1 hypothetical protein ATH50_2567 [Haloplanus aerogenes]